MICAVSISETESETQLSILCIYHIHIFFHPDFTVGLGISPNHALRLVGYTTGRELHPALKILFNLQDKYNHLFNSCQDFLGIMGCCLFKFLCVTLPHMSIGAGVIVAVTFQQVDNAPDTETGTERDNEGLKNGDSLIEKCHKL